MNSGKSSLVILGATLFGVAITTGRASAQSAGGLEEVVVTAQRREQSLQSVPIAIAAFTDEALVNAGIDSTAELTSIAPGLVWVTGRVAGSMYLRGVGTTEQAVGQEQPVTMYVDGIYYPDMNGTTLSLSNTERVEVLRGPQGTLFGRNAVGGLVNIVTKTPSQQTGGSVEVGYGNYETFHSKFYGTTGIAPTLAADLSVYYYDQSGNWGRNLTTGEDVNTKDETISVRTKWYWEPATSTRVTLAFDYTDREADIGSQRVLFEGALGLDGLPHAGSIYDTQSNLGTDGLVGSSEQSGVSLTLEHDLNAFTFRSLSSYRDSSMTQYADVEATALPLVDFAVNDSGSHHVTQEINILSPGDSAFDWILGVFYMDRDAKYDDLQLSGLAFPGGVRFTPQWAIESIAGFGQATFAIPALSDTKLTLGLRHTSDKIAFDIGLESISPNVPLVQSSDESTWSEYTWRVVLDHHFTSDIMGYLSYNRGFKSGTYNPLDDTATPIDPEILDAYEVGLKTDLYGDRLRLNAVAFYNDYQDLQLEVASGVLVQKITAPAAKVWGVELDVEAVITDRLNVRGNLSWIPEADYEDFPNAPFFIPNPDGGNLEVAMNGKGQRLVNTPEFTLYVGADYTVPVSFGSLVFSGNYNFNDGSFWTIDNRISGNRRHIVNVSGTWKSRNEHWNVRLWSNNLLDEEYYSEGNIGDFGDVLTAAAPRTYGLSAGYKF